MSQFSNLDLGYAKIDSGEDDNTHYTQNYAPTPPTKSYDTYDYADENNYIGYEDQLYAQQKMDPKFRNMVKIKNAYIDEDEKGHITINSTSGKKYSQASRPDQGRRPGYQVKKFDLKGQEELHTLDEYQNPQVKTASRGVVRKKYRPSTQIEGKVLRSKKRAMTGVTSQARKKSTTTSSSSRGNSDLRGKVRRTPKSKTAFSKSRLKRPPTVKGSQKMESD